jgi:hypothetical protein
MRANWFWEQATKEVSKNCQSRMTKAAKVLAAAVRAKCPVGTISHPMYEKGKYKKCPWTKRDGGSLKRSVRVVEKKDKYGVDIIAKYASIGIVGGPRVYVGNYYAYYAQIVEFYTPFMRPTVQTMQGEMKSILENG